MSIFSSIKNAIFGHKAKAATPPAAAPAPTAPPAASAAPAAIPVAPTEPAAISEVDVEANLTAMGAGKDLNWKTSIVDLMKLLGIDSSLANRKELATELGYTGDLDGSAEMNIWLHKATMRQLAANGGKVPAAMVD
jgi:3-oxoacyl-ACP reductase-like protein